MTVNDGETATFSVTATGVPAPTYKWQKNGVLVSGATSSSYTTPAVGANDNGAAYSVVISNSAGSVVSSQATLTVKSPPQLFSFQPSHGAYGFNVVLDGKNYSSSTTVEINGVPSKVLTATATTLTVAIPQNGTTGPITVKNADGTATSPSAFVVDPYGPPITISTGGTYSGNWQSLDPQVAAVRITTSQPVIVENCQVRTMGDGIQAYNTNATLTVRNCTGDAVNPNVRGMRMGYFVAASFFASVVVEHNVINHFNVAAQAANFPLTNAETFHGQKVSFRYNVVHDVEGRFSDGQNGFLTGNYGEGTSTSTSAFTLYGVRDAIAEISWNEIVNQPYVSQSEDVINVPESRGTASNPIDIHDNYVEGARPANATTYPTFSGCGIQTGDSPSKTDVGFVHVHDNQVVGFSGCGLSISSGHNIEIDHNRAISARTLPDGSLMNNQWRVPLEIQDWYWWRDSGGSEAFVDPFWHDNSMHDNAFAAVTREGYSANNYFITLSQTVTQYNNTSALDHLATTADEVAEFQRWRQKVAASGLTVGRQ